MRIWLVITLVALVVLLERASFIVLFSRWEMPTWLVRALRFVPVAVFPALIAPMFLFTDGVLNLSPTNPRIWAGLIAAAVAWRSKSLLATIVSGMAAYWLLLLFL